MAAEYVQALKDGESWDQVLLLSPTHAEGKLVVDAVRQQLRAEGMIGKEDQEFTRWVNADLTEAERGDSRNYRPGRVDMIQFYAERQRAQDAASASSWPGIDPASLPLDQAAKFQAYRKESITLAEGDILRFTANGMTLDEAPDTQRLGL